MAQPRVADRVLETSSSTGTGPFTLAGAEAEHVTFEDGIGVGPQCYYIIVHPAANTWELGEGHLTSATTIVRDRPIKSTNGDALVSFTSGQKRVFCPVNAELIAGLLYAGDNLTWDDTAKLLTVGTGDDFPTVAGKTIHALSGTLASPRTAVGSTVKAVTYYNVSQAALDAVGSPGNDGADWMGTIQGVAIGTAGCEAQVVGVRGLAATLSTLSGIFNDACGVYGQGNVASGGKGTGIGAFFAGYRDSTEAAAAALGVEITVGNNAGTATDYDPAGFSLTTGIWLNAYGQQCGVGLAIAAVHGKQFDVGIGFVGHVSGGFTGGIKTNCIRDDTNCVTSIVINGAKSAYGIDLSGGTFGLSAIKLPAGTTVADGLAWGGDSFLYRSAANTLKCEYHFIVGAQLTAGSAVLGATTITGATGITGATTVTGSFGVTGAATVTNGITVSGGGAAITGVTTVTGSFGVTGAATVTNGVTVSGGGASITGATTVTGTLGVTGNTTVTGTATVTNGVLAVTGTITDPSIAAVQFTPTLNISTEFKSIVSCQATVVPTAPLTNVLGLLFLPTLSGTEGVTTNTIATLNGVYSRVDTAASYDSNVTQLNAFTAASPTHAGGGTIGLYAGYYSDLNTGTARITNTYQLYLVGNAPCYLGGPTTLAAGTLLNTYAILGEGVDLTLGTSTGSSLGSAANQKTGMHGARVVQHTATGTATGFTAGGGTAVTHTSTFTGNTGSAAYTIGDIIQALKLKGIMAP